MSLFKAIVEKVASRKDKTYSIVLGTQEMSGEEVGEIMENLQEFVNVLILPEDPELMMKLLEFLKKNAK